MKRYSLVLVLVLALTLVLSSTVLADGAIVINRADESGCGASVLGGTYVGYWTWIQTPKGNQNLVCKAKLVAGPPVPEEIRVAANCLAPDDTTLLTGFVEITPGGELIGVCQLK